MRRRRAFAKARSHSAHPLSTSDRRLASYAETVAASRGRLVPEPISRTRTAFARDRDRIIHCTAFRRLKE